MSPIIWDLGHIGHFEEVWLVEKLDSGGDGSEGLRGTYNPFENPRSSRGQLDLPTLAECFEYQDRVREAASAKLDEVLTDGGAELARDGFVYRMVAQHEYQHNETILQTLQLKQGEPYPTRSLRRSTWLDAPGDQRNGNAGDEPMVRFPGGRVTIGTNDRSAAYDNERDRHTEQLTPFWIDATPVTNEAFLRFVETGGYGNRALWSAAGWSWVESANVRAPMHWDEINGEWHERFMDLTRPLDPQRPVCHVCFHEADAFARWSDKRLPTEAEWEAAATWDPDGGEAKLFPWGDEEVTSEHANVDMLAFDTAPVWSYPTNVSPIGCYGMIGDVWEWTASGFLPYPGFEAFPYAGYSEAFFGDEYKVLRGGSWATRPGALRSTFRNWDYPIRRQIFSGFRCARDE